MFDSRLPIPFLIIVAIISLGGIVIISLIIWSCCKSCFNGTVKGDGAHFQDLRINNRPSYQTVQFQQVPALGGTRTVIITPTNANHSQYPAQPMTQPSYVPPAQPYYPPTTPQHQPPSHPPPPYTPQAQPLCNPNYAGQSQLPYNPNYNPQVSSSDHPPQPPYNPEVQPEYNPGFNPGQNPTGPYFQSK